MPPSDPVDGGPPEEAVADPVDGFDPPLLSAREAARQGHAGLAGAGRGLPAADGPRPDGSRRRPDHPASAQRPSGRSGSMGASPGRGAPALAGRRGGCPGLRRPSPSVGAGAPARDRPGVGGAGAPLRARGRALRGAHPADVGAPLALGRGELPGRPTGRRRRATSGTRRCGRPTRRSRSIRGIVECIGELDHLATVTSRSFIVPYVGAHRRRGRRPPPTRTRCRRSCTSRWRSCSIRPSSGRRSGPSRGRRTGRSSSSSSWVTPCGARRGDAPPAPRPA